jgi:hypothetical protein
MSNSDLPPIPLFCQGNPGESKTMQKPKARIICQPKKSVCFKPPEAEWLDATPSFWKSGNIENEKYHNYLINYLIHYLLISRSLWLTNKCHDFQFVDNHFMKIA